MTEERLVALIFKRLSGKLIPEEARELETWAEAAPKNREFLKRNEGIIEKEINHWKNIDPAEGFAKWLKHWKAKRRAKILRISGVSVAASLLLVVIAVALIGKTNSVVQPPTVVSTKAYREQPRHNVAMITLSNGKQILLDNARKGELAMQGGTQLVKDDSSSISYVGGTGGGATMAYNILTTPRSGQYHLRLPDGSQVWLNNESSLRYPTSFRGKDRTVELTGEAYFDIAANPLQPFIVKVARESVEVLGTSFNIMAYPEEGGTKTTLLTGFVRVRAGTSVVKLKPDEQAQLEADGSLRVEQGVPSQEIISWKNGFFYFGGIAPFDVVMRQLARWYDIDVIYEGKAPQVEFDGKIDRSLSLDEVLKFLNANQIHTRLEGRKLIVLPN